MRRRRTAGWTEQARRLRVTSLLVVLVATAAAMILTTSASAAIYSVTDIGTLGGETSEATAINIWGEVTGSAETNRRTIPGGGSVIRAFRYRNGALTDLGPTEKPGEPTIGSRGNAINNKGDVAGGIEYAADSRAGIFKANGTVSGVPCADCYEPTAFGINDADEVVGGGIFNTAPWVTTSDDKTTSIGGEAPFCFGPSGGRASAINDSGEVVGETRIPDQCGAPPAHAFLYSGGTISDLGTLGGKTSAATAINRRGLVVGTSETASVIVTPYCGFFPKPECRAPHHAFSYQDGTMTDLGTLAGTEESWAYGVNDLGEIVGTSGEEVEGPHGRRISGHAFLCLFGRMIDLNTLIPSNSGWTLEAAHGINDFGEIVGTGLHNGIERGFILKPGWLWF